MKISVQVAFALLFFFWLDAPAQSQYNFTYAIASGEFTSEQQELFDAGFVLATDLWESVLLGHEGIDGPFEFPIEIRIGGTQALASANPSGVFSHNGFIVPDSRHHGCLRTGLGQRDHDCRARSRLRNTVSQ